MNNNEFEFEELKDEGSTLSVHTGSPETIKVLQKELNSMGYTDALGRQLSEDGIFGINTFNAVIKFQEENGLVPDGIVGDKTWKAISDKKKEKENMFSSDVSETEDLYFMNSDAESKSPETSKIKESGVIKPGYNAKGEWSEDPDAYNYGEDSAKYKLLTVFDEAYAIATENDRRTAQIAIDVTVDNLRNYDTESITQAYYLIDNQGAYGAGHAGLLLINEDGESILFSYIKHSKAGVWPFGVQSDMRIGVFDEETTDKFLWGATIKTPTSNGDFCTEQYDKGLKYKITPEQGKKILESGINIATKNPRYNLLFSNCSQIAQTMLINGGVLQVLGIIPKVRYLENIILSDGIIVNGK